MPEVPAPDGDIRVSDAQRQAVVDRLSTATGDGLLTLEEFADAAGAAYAAVTRAELDAVTRELRLPVAVPLPPPNVATSTSAEPAAAGPAAEAPARRRWVVAVMSGEKRRGRWRIGTRTGAFALMGGIDLDLREAVLESDVVDIEAWAIMGSVTVIVPEGVAVEVTGFVLMGGTTNKVKALPSVPDVPVIRVRARGLWGGVDVRSRSPRQPGGRHLAHEIRDRVLENHERMMEGFLAGPRPPAPPAPPVPPVPPAPAAPAAAPPTVEQAVPARGGLVTVVCTDIVGSTRYADTLGDQRWRGVLMAHNALVREQLARHGGVEVKTSGDGFLTTFTSARSAVTFAVAVQDAIADYRAGHPDTPLEVRVGVHAGEVERDGHDIVGRNVTIACRLCDAAAPGQVLASAVVAELADSASDLAFGDPVDHRLSGIDRSVTARPAARR